MGSLLKYCVNIQTLPIYSSPTPTPAPAGGAKGAIRMYQNNLTEKQIEKAAKWWADQVCKPTFSGLSDEECKDPRNRAYQFAEVMASILTEPVDGDQRQQFIDALKEELRSPEYNPFWGLDVDYHPCRTLANAAAKAGVPLTNFPWKTHMRFTEDGAVEAALGYGAPMETI
jgi:hypothetical protein